VTYRLKGWRNDQWGDFLESFDSEYVIMEHDKEGHASSHSVGSLASGRRTR
jgi:hypothetical protein